MFNSLLSRQSTGAAAPDQIERSSHSTSKRPGLPLTAWIMSTALVLGAVAIPTPTAAATTQEQTTAPVQVTYGTVKVDGLNIAYREAGNPASPFAVEDYFSTNMHRF